MDVRCEKCGTEYELDEARLKPGGVTVKCTSCGHTFKIRKRAPEAEPPTIPSTITGMPRPQPPAPAVPPVPAARPQPAPAPAAASSVAMRATDAAATERQWLIRLENGETRACRELSTLQQWIIAGEVTRDALISRSGKTWKLLGDITELGTYFAIADEARNQRTKRESAKQAAKKPDKPDKLEEARTTLVGVGAVSSGAMALGDLDDIEDATDNEPTQARRITGPTARTAPMAVADDDAHSRSTAPHSVEASRAASASARMAAAPPARPGSLPTTLAGAARPPAPGGSGAVPKMSAAPGTPAPAAPATTARLGAATPAAPPAPTAPAPVVAPVAPTPEPSPAVTSPGMAPAQAQVLNAPSGGGRESAPWTGGVAASAAASAGPTEGPVAGRLAHIADEPAFTAGKSVRGPVASATVPFTGTPRHDEGPSPVGASGAFPPDDDRGPAVAPRGSRAGLWIAIASLVVIAGGFAVLYLLVLKPGSSATAKIDAGTVALASDAGATAAVPDAAAPAPTPDAAPEPDADDDSSELRGNLEARMRAALTRLADDPAHKDDPRTLALRARLATALAQSLEDRASFLPSTSKAEIDKLRKESKALVLEAVPPAQRAYKQAASSASSNLAMADLLRLQGKPAKDVRRYLDAARAAKAPAQDLALIEGLLLARDGKLAEARKLLTETDSGAASLEQSGDVRLRFRVAAVAAADGKPVDARGALDAVLAAQPEHEGARALQERLERTVADTDPLPPEENTGSGSQATDDGPSAGSGDSYDKLVQRADKLAENRGCAKAVPLYESALDKVPNGVDALIGLGFCHVELKQFSSAISKFRTVLSLQPRNERALWGIAQLYQEQDNKPRAIEAYREYLEKYPDSAPAKRQLERLGAPVDGGGGEPKPAPEPAPPAAPAPAEPAPAS